MPFFRDQDHVERLISVLSAHLLAGQNIWQDIFYGYKIEAKKKAGFDAQAYEAQQWARIVEWKEDTADFIRSSLPIHYDFLFTSPLRSSLSLDNWPRNISRMVLSMEHHLNQLEQIILRLEELQRMSMIKKHYRSSRGRRKSRSSKRSTWMLTRSSPSRSAIC